MPIPENLNLEQQRLVDLLLSLGQEHLFEKWTGQEQPSHFNPFFEQISKLNQSYPGGLKHYVQQAQTLLKDSAEGVNPFEGAQPQVPQGKKLDFNTPLFHQMEQMGMEHISECAFVLVAGGLGERLGYPGIKIALPCETLSNKSYLEYYIDHILAFSEQPQNAELAIMTSDDTHPLTESFLLEHQYFGFPKDQLHLLKQEKVPSLLNTQAQFVSNPEHPFEIETKPHGHGDVHTLLFQSGLLENWKNKKKRWVVFFQDTNALVFNAIPAALGSSVSENLDVNSITVPRKAGEAAGGITRLQYEDGRDITVNVEYNQLDPLLKATVNPKGDTADESGYSPYPGNINALVFSLNPYFEQLQKSKGQIREFVNPKYADSSKQHFKKPTRLECMMQDYPLDLPKENNVGFTRFDRWFCFSAAKNDLRSAAEKAQQGLPPESASSAEFDLYASNRSLLRSIGIDIDEDHLTEYSDIPLPDGAKIIWTASFSTVSKSLKQKFKRGSISSRSVLLLDGENITIENLQLDGALTIKACSSAHVIIKSCSVKNNSWIWRPLEANSDATPESTLRGYHVQILETKELIFDQPGEYIIEL